MFKINSPFNSEKIGSIPFGMYFQFTILRNGNILTHTLDNYQVKKGKLTSESLFQIWNNTESIQRFTWENLAGTRPISNLRKMLPLPDGEHILIWDYKDADHSLLYIFNPNTKAVRNIKLDSYILEDVQICPNGQAMIKVLDGPKRNCIQYANKSPTYLFVTFPEMGKYKEILIKYLLFVEIAKSEKTNIPRELKNKVFSFFTPRQLSFNEEKEEKVLRIR